MFKYFKNIKNLNKVWKLLNEKYFGDLKGNLGSTVIKIEEDPLKGNYLVVKTENEKLRSILELNETLILNDINKETGTSLAKINFL